MVVSDHAEYLGLPQAFADGDPDILKTESGKKWAADLKKGGKAGYEAFVQMTAQFADAKPSIPAEALAKLYRTVWDGSIEAAERNNKPGVFTAINGFEWTQSIKGNNLHRTVVFRDGPDRTKKVRPFSEFDGVDPEDLWKYMADYEEKTGGRVLAIEHNPNLSCGKMFAPTTESGKPFDAKYAAMRARFEPLVEASQSKGDSETTPQLSPHDPFADFERRNKANIFGLVATTPEMLPYNYVRSALKMGLQHEAKLGVNPFKFGMIGASDQHTSLSHHPRGELFRGGHYRRTETRPLEGTLSQVRHLPQTRHVHVGDGAGRPDGRLGAREHPRGHLGRAVSQGGVLHQRDAPHGARLRRLGLHGQGVRQSRSHLGGERLRPRRADGRRSDQSPQGQGAELHDQARCDSEGAFLDRVQIIKGWLDGKGETHEKVVDVAWSGDRKPDAKTGQVPLVGSTVDVKNATLDEHDRRPAADRLLAGPGLRLRASTRSTTCA